MRPLDYLRLGAANVVAHKRRALTVVAIVGLLFSVLVAGVLDLQGTEDAVISTMLTPTDGKVYVTTSVDTMVCEDKCDFETGVAEIEANIAKYGGKVLRAGYLDTMDGVFIELTEPILGLTASAEGRAVSVPLEKAAALAGIKLPEADASAASKIALMQQIATETRGRVINSLDQFPNYQPMPGTEGDYLYYIADFLPGGFRTGSLALSNVTEGSNPLDLLFGGIATGTSQNLLYDDGEIETNSAEMGMVLAEFPNLETATDYYRDEANYCAEMDHIFSHCKRQYKYQVLPVVSNPMGAREYFQTAWLILGIAIIVLMVVAVLVAVGTYARLVGKDVKVISLYYAMGATRRQVRLVYLTYLMLLSLMAVVFALGVGYGLAALLSVFNAEALSQVFMLGFGLTEQPTIWLMGWNEWILAMLGVILLTIIVTIILSEGQFSRKSLAKNLK